MANAPHFKACLDRINMRSASSMVLTGRLGIIAAQCPHPRLTAARTHPVPFQHCAHALRGMSSAAGSSRGSVRAAAQGNVLTLLKKAFGMGTTVRMHARTFCARLTTCAVTWLLRVANGFRGLLTHVCRPLLGAVSTPSAMTTALQRTTK